MSTADRVYLVRQNSAVIAVALGRALAGGVEVGDLVVLLMDTRDPVGRDLAVAILERSADLDLDAEEARALRRGEIPTGLALIPVAAVEELFKDTHPAVSATVRRRPPAGGVRVVVVAGGGATLMHLPVAARGPTGTA